MYTGEKDDVYYQVEMVSPNFKTDRDLCVELFIAAVRPHEYSSTFLEIYQNSTMFGFSYQKVFSLGEYRKDLTLQWHRVEFPVTAGYFNLQFIAGGHRSIIAIDDVLLYEGNCSGKYFYEFRFLVPELYGLIYFRYWNVLAWLQFTSFQHCDL